MNKGDPLKLQSVANSPELETLIPTYLEEDVVQINTVELEPTSGHRVWSFFNKGLRVIVGNDDRTLADTTKFPYRAIVKLVVRHKNGIVEHGTGFLISPNCLITAGHCVHKYGQWVRQIEIHSSVGSVNKMILGSKFISVSGWINGYDERYDYGAIILNESSLYDHIKGSLGAKVLTADTSAVEVAGYPIHGWRMLKALGRVIRRDDRVEHNVDTYWGNSGSPLLCQASRQVVGVHNSGSEAKQTNYAVTVLPEVMGVWSKWSKVENQQNQPV